MGSEVGGLSTSLGLYASPPLILSTESVVVMEWKGMSTSRACRLQLRTEQGKMQGADGKRRCKALRNASEPKTLQGRECASRRIRFVSYN